MSRLLVIGCGGVASVAIRKCCQNSDVFTEIMIASRTKEKCDALKEKIESTTKTKIETAKVDADNVAEVAELIRAYKPDAVLNVALPYQDLTIMDACLEAGADYIDTANYEAEDTEDPTWRAIYEKRCKEKGFTAYFDYSWQWAYQDRFKEDRNMYHMSEDIKVDFIDNNEFVNRHHTPAFCWRYLVQKLNAKYGIFNKEKYNDILADAIFPKKTREKWVKYLNEQNYDIIITTASLSLRLGMLAPELNAKTIGWQHNCYAGYLDVPNVVFWKQECLLQEYLPKLDRYIVLSDYDKRDYKKFLDIDTEVKINPRSFVSERKCDPKSKRFLMATRFVYAKGLDLMMESFEEFCKQDDEWQLDIIGAGDLWNQIVADAKRRGIEDRVNFVGYTNEPEKYYLNSSVFLLPSRWEGWPMVIMEAFEFGLPVIAFHTGAMDLIIDDGKTGYLPEAFDTKKFTDAMLKLAHDEELRREMSRNAIWKSEDFAIEKAVKEWNRLFNRVMGIKTFYMKNEEQILECREKYPLRTSYAEFVKEYQIRDNTILYEAFGGRGMICNPYALFLYLLEKEEYQDYTHIWVLEDFEDNRKQIEKYEQYPNVRFVKYKSKEYCKELATVKYLVNNVSFPSYFLKREGQVLIDTWHGTPLKNMGFDIPGANISQGNTARNLLSADYIVSSGPYMTKTAYKDSYKMQNLYEGTVLEEIGRAHV